MYCPEELGFFIQKLVLDNIEVIYADIYASLCDKVQFYEYVENQLVHCLYASVGESF